MSTPVLPRAFQRPTRSCLRSSARPALAVLAAILAAAMAGPSVVLAQTHNYFGTSGTLNGNAWSTNPAGPFTSPLNTSGGAIINFDNATTSMTGGTIAVAGINATANATITTTGGTITNMGGGVVPIHVLGGVTLDFSSQSFTSSVTAGYRKEGDGTLALAGGTYGGGFTLNAGTVVVRGVNALGQGGVLTVNGGTIAANPTRDLSNKFNEGIVIGGDFTFGATTGVALPSASLTFSNDVTLGANTRKITLGGTGVYALGGSISGSGGLTVDATAAGTLVLSGANTYQGPTTIQSGTVRFTRPAALYNGVIPDWTPANLVVQAQAFAVFNVGGTSEFAAADISAVLQDTGFEAAANLVLDTTNASTGKFVQSSPLAEPAGKSVNLVKDGFGTLALASANDFSGQTTVRNGTLQIGDGGSTGDLGLSSNVVNNGTVRIQRAGELTLPQPISGTGSLVHTGPGSTTLTGSQSYTGTTSVSGGTLAFSGSAGLANGASLSVSGAASAALRVDTSGTLVFNNSVAIGNADQSGAVHQAAGTLNLTNATNYLTVGAGGYGSYAISGGSLNITGTTGIRVGAQSSSGAGIFTQAGGNISFSRNFSIGQGSGTGIATFIGGSITTTTSYGFIIGESGTGSGTLNLGTQAGGNAIITSQAANVTPGFIIGSGAPGTVDLNSGTLRITANGIRKGNAAATLNLNGATIQSGAASLLLIEGAVPTTVYRGGAVIDTQAHTATIAAALSPAAGNGLYPAAGIFPATGGLGYIGAPLVTISGGPGSGATAIAEISNGAITAIHMTSAGQNYRVGDSVTFQFTGGGAATAANSISHTLTAADLAPNSAGGLTKLGTGTLHLTGASTYTGDTLVSSGTLLVSGSVSGSTVRVENGATLAGPGTVHRAILSDGARLSPGNGPGTLTISDSLDLTSGSILTMQLSGTNQAIGGGINDHIVAHSLSLAGALNVMEILAGSFQTASPGDRWRLIDYTPGGLTDNVVTLGTAPNLPAGLSFTIDTSAAGRVDLVVVPEPTTSFALITGIGVVLTRRRRPFSDCS